MKRIYLFFCFTLIFICTALGQNNAEIRGVVVDGDQKAMERATVSVVSAQDSIVQTYTLTTHNGKFELFKIPAQKDLILHISHINSTGYTKNIRLKSGEKLNLDTISLEGISIEEVVVVMQSPIRMNGDTLEYKADYFKTRPNATVEELLQLLPGLQVNVDGSIIYQGRTVSGIRVNNKDFFAHDLTIATRNLDASLVDVVQVIKDKEGSKREVIDDIDLPVVINLKMKREFLKANFGKVYGSGGTRDRYESGALINTFRDTLQVSFIGYANNLSRKGFEYSEMSEYGGMGRAENNSISWMSYGGLQNNLYAGINLNYDLGNKLKTNLMYNFEQQDDYTDTRSENKTFYGDTVEIGDNINSGKYKNFHHKIRGLIRYLPDTTSRIQFTTNINLSHGNGINEGIIDTRRFTDIPVVKGNSNNEWRSRSPNYEHSFSTEKKFTNRWLLSLNHSLYSRNSSRSALNDSYRRFYLFNDSIVNQGTITGGDNRSLNLNNTLNLQIPFHKNLNIDFFSKYNVSQEKDVQDIMNRINSEEYVDRNDVANNKDADIRHWIIGSKINANLFKELRISLGLDWIDLSRAYHYYDRIDDIKTINQYWLPNFSVNYKGINVNYNRSVSPPGFYYLVAVNSDLYPTSLTVASPYFENEITDNYGLRYFKNFQKSKINLNFSVSYRRTDTSVGSSTFYNTENSFNTQENYQAPGTDNFYSNFSLNKRFVQNKIWNISYRTSMYGSGYWNYSIVNHEENSAVRYYGNVSNTLELSYKNNITIIPTYEIGTNFVRNKIETNFFRNVTNFNHTIGSVFRWNNLYKARIEASYMVRNQPSGLQNNRVNLHLLNTSVYYPVMQKGELKLTAFDLLNQNQNIQVGAFGNNTFYREQLTLRQYFLFGFVYKFLTTSNK